MRDYTSWRNETTDQEQRDEQTASYERFIGKQMAKASIREYDGIHRGDHGHEHVSRRSARKFANELAYAEAS